MGASELRTFTSVPENLRQADDATLVNAVLRKDRKATAEFVALHADAVHSYVRQRLIPRGDLVDDLVQEVFLAAWESLSRFRGESSLRSWLLGIARHKVEDYYRARLRDPEALPDGEEGSAAESLLVEAQLDEFLDRERLHARTRQVLETLPEKYGLVLLWRYWEKRSALEMAEKTGKTEKAIERLLARAREQFRRKWNCE